jgi:hypothetical protein
MEWNPFNPLNPLNRSKKAYLCFNRAGQMQQATSWSIH